MIGFDVLPRREDYFPKTKRGHGTTHRDAHFDKDGIKIREANPCCDPTCSLNAPKSKNLHTDHKANMQDWCDERGLTTKYLTPYQAMVKATGGK